jgi:hypothetical protein
MTRRWTGAAALLALFTLGVVTVALATARQPRAAAHTSLAGHAMRMAPTASAAAAGRKGTVVKTLEATGTIQPGTVNGSSGRCPRRAPHAISGYWGTDEANRDGDLVVVRSSPLGGRGRRWEVALKNVGATPVTAYVGIVCIK